MAKAQLTFDLEIAPMAAFSLLGPAMTHCEAPPYSQEGWTLHGRESYGIFKMGWPVKMRATVHPTSSGGSRIELYGQNFGWAFNTLHLNQMLRNIEQAMRYASGRMLPAHYMNPPAADAGGALPPVLRDDPSLPPRVG